MHVAFHSFCISGQRRYQRTMSGLGPAREIATTSMTMPCHVRTLTSWMRQGNAQMKAGGPPSLSATHSPFSGPVPSTRSGHVRPAHLWGIRRRWRWGEPWPRPICERWRGVRRPGDCDGTSERLTSYAILYMPSLNSRYNKEFVKMSNRMDEVWVPSKFSKETLILSGESHSPIGALTSESCNGLPFYVCHPNSCIVSL